MVNLPPRDHKTRLKQVYKVSPRSVGLYKMDLNLDPMDPFHNSRVEMEINLEVRQDQQEQMEL